METNHAKKYFKSNIIHKATDFILSYNLALQTDKAPFKILGSWA